MPQWVFERQTRDGGASGEAVPNAVEAGGWSCTEELLVREAIQNSVDASKDPESAVRVGFRLLHHTGAEKKRAIELLQLSSFADRDLEEKLKLLPGNVLEFIQDPLKPLNLLFIEDWNCKGLGGALFGKGAGNFFRLLFVIGDGSKGDQNDGSGGSFGFGKGVYAYNSNIRTIYAFSVFEPTEDSGGVWARLLGCSYLPSHEFDDTEWTGRAWFGLPSNNADGQSPLPLVNEEACRLAKELGFSVRTRDEHGTSIMIVGCDSSEGPISIDRLTHAAETWWWPRITDGLLQVELESQGERQPGLDPGGRPDLQPYIKARNCVLGRDRDETVAVTPYNRMFGLGIGAAAVLAIAPDQPAYEALTDAQNVGEDRQGKTPAHRSIAYIRRPGMVVTYRSWNDRSNASAVGVFQADPDIDRHLKLSEPVEHDRWDPHSRRLGRLDNGAKIVKSVEDRNKRYLRDFLKNLQPPPPPPRSGLDWLGRQMGQILTPRNRANPPPPHGERGALSIQTEREPATQAMEGGMVKLKASYSIALKPQSAEQTRSVLVAPKINVLEGDDGARGEPLVLTVREEDGATAAGIKPEITISLASDTRRIVTVESELFSADWAVSLHLEASLIEEQAI